MQRLVELKNAPVVDNPLAHIRQLRDVADEFMTKMTVLLRERKAVLDELDLSLEACIRLLGIAIDRLVQKGVTEAEWEVSDQVLTLFPDDLRAHFRRGRATEASAKASGRRRNPATANS